jgi:hypothetical protein
LLYHRAYGQTSLPQIQNGDNDGINFRREEEGIVKLGDGLMRGNTTENIAACMSCFYGLDMDILGGALEGWVGFTG